MQKRGVASTDQLQVFSAIHVRDARETFSQFFCEKNPADEHPLLFIVLGLMQGLCFLQAMSDNEQDWLALRPQEPSPSQCCGSGCKPCIYDVYEKELAQWERAKAMQDKSLLMGEKEQVHLSASWSFDHTCSAVGLW